MKKLLTPPSLAFAAQTELCRSFEETGSCRYGAKCQFAHGREELRPVQRHPKYKTEVGCSAWWVLGWSLGSQSMHADDVGQLLNGCC